LQRLQLWRSSVAALLQLQSLTAKASRSEFLFSFSNNQKICIGLGNHNVEEPGFIHQSTCRCLQPIFWDWHTRSGKRMRNRVGEMDPGDISTIKSHCQPFTV
jgi:hypothetical protein